MALRDRMAISAAPIFLRIGLGVTFLWAGLGKLLSDMPVQGQDAAILANMGANIGPGTPPAPIRVEPIEPTTPPPPAPEPESEKGDDAPAATPSPTPAEESKAKAEKGVKNLDGKKSNRPPALMALAAPQAEAIPPKFTMADFPEPRNVKAVNGVAIFLWKSTHPSASTDGTSKMALAPAWTGEGSWPIRLAWVAAVCETLGGTLLLVGLFTRLSALTLAWTMGVAIWLTVIGPAIQSGETMLGFLPRHARFDTNAWKTPLWQLSLFTGALALFFAGPGAASLDSVIFARDSSPEPKPKSAE